MAKNIKKHPLITFGISESEAPTIASAGKFGLALIHYPP